MRKFLSLLLLPYLTACTFTHPVKGVVENEEHERFLGTATASLLEANANIDITTDSGTHCFGIYPRPLSAGGGVSASGTFNCNDGRTGSFAFEGTPHGGEGFGRLSTGDKFRFKYGDGSSPEDSGAAALALQSLGQSMQNVSPQPPAASVQPFYPPVQPFVPPPSIHCTTSPAFHGLNATTDCSGY